MNDHVTRADLMRATLALMGWVPLRDMNYTADSRLGWEAFSHDQLLWGDGACYRMMGGLHMQARLGHAARFRPAAWADVPFDVLLGIYGAIRTQELKR
jgi:hypothetical protein